MNGSTTQTIKKHRWDILVIVALLSLSLALLIVINLLKKPGDVAVVEIDGQIAGEYPLSSNGTFPLNGGTNVLVIEDGVAYLNYSNCPDHTCERTGIIRYVGQTIVCLPNRLIVTVKGASDGGVDLVS